jgi:peptidoglycan/LPS O-acetylase OafA/YrhL
MRAFLGNVIKRCIVVPSSGQHWDLLDGLRGLAILMVVLCHGVYANPQGPAWTRWVAGFIGAGHLGVQVFFVLSGFLITYPFCRARMQDPEAWYVPGYAARRALKIFPPFYLIIVLLAAFYLLHYEDISYLFAGLKWSVGIPHLVYQPQKFNGSFWSLWVELGFYLLLPLAFWCTRGRGAMFTAVLFASLLFFVPLITRSANWPTGDLNPAYKLYILARSPNSLTNFSWGVLFAAIYATRREGFGCGWARVGYLGTFLLAGTMALSMVLTLTGWTSEQVTWELLMHLSGISAFLMLFFIFDPGCLGTRVFSAPALRYIGIISYEWFLLHQPALVETHAWFGTAGGSFGRYALIVFGPILISLLLAMAIYHFFSAPIIRWGRDRLKRAVESKSAKPPGGRPEGEKCTVGA